MYLTAMTHRDELFDLTMRWMNDDFHADDGEILTRIFVYESAISALVIERVLLLLGRFWNTELRAERIRFKHELRDRIIARLGVQTPRMAELAEKFHNNPKYFFPFLPIDGLVVTDNSARLLALGRIKRMARVAEKVSFRLVEALFKEIQAQARFLAQQRATQAGVPLDEFVSSDEAMQNDFVQAEEALARSFRDRKIHIGPDALTINDILGFKIIAPQKMLDRLPLMLTDEPGMRITEIQKHSGNYNAVNLLLDLELPPVHELTARLRGMNWDIAGKRGLNPDDIRKNIESYVSQGAGSVTIELILTTPEELMEAEFGRSIHELRVLRLRQRQEYQGPLGQNAGYLIEYMLALASSPTIRVPEIPIKIYGRYLPEEISALKRSLYGSPVEDGLLGTFCLHEGCLEQFFPPGTLVEEA
ncbi:hypothetical protein SAMN04488082_10525 [Desulfomicrobium apsheronum]|uniref:Uncharacterized protein n=1 Tax=Desulfomicrobium apsheronum TaxID=52560 RepID=A0A1I3T0Q3_9BACT|nr:hypothetical protein [Desulfomicrobium apsheronum]SFJ64072.1 hypothetical protein SAMN04488082_10525 [Desulfomicrobium apsheronum]